MKQITCHISPSARRSLSDLSEELRARRVALLLGAGVDHALNNAPLWGKLVPQLFPKGSVADVFPPDWLLEIAMVAKNLVGDEQYLKSINKSIEGLTEPIEQAGLTEKTEPLAAYKQYSLFPMDETQKVTKEALCILAKTVPLIVTTNFSDGILNSIKSFNPLVENYSTLRAIEVPEPGRTPTGSPPLVVYIHGRGATNETALDRGSFDSLEYQDPHYLRFLEQLFERWTVLIYGYSMSDIPARVAASRARRIRPEIRKSHVWIEKEIDETLLAPISRASITAFSIKRINVNNFYNGAKLLRTIASNAQDTSLTHKIIDAAKNRDWSLFADHLDAAGDFESKAQQGVFQYLNPLTIFENIRKLYVDPFTMVRIERHLRHHLYHSKSFKQNPRLNFWVFVADSLTTSGHWQEVGEEDSRLALDFLLGYHEIKNLKDTHPNLIEQIRKCSRTLKGIDAVRFSKADKLWSGHKGSTQTGVKALNDLMLWCAGVGWEAMEAKLALDIARTIILNASTDNKPTTVSIRVNVLKAIQKARASANVAGTTSRLFGALILEALWVPSKSEARVILRAAIDLAKRGGAAESVIAGISWAWCHAQQQSANPNPYVDVKDELFSEVGLEKPDINSLKRQDEYYKPYIPSGGSWK